MSNPRGFIFINLSWRVISKGCSQAYCWRIWTDVSVSNTTWAVGATFVVIFQNCVVLSYPSRISIIPDQYINFQWFQSGRTQIASYWQNVRRCIWEHIIYTFSILIKVYVLSYNIFFSEKTSINCSGSTKTSCWYYLRWIT